MDETSSYILGYPAATGLAYPCHQPRHHMTISQAVQGALMTFYGLLYHVPQAEVYPWLYASSTSLQGITILHMLML